MAETPFTRIQQTLAQILPEQLLDLLPRKYEKIGEIVLIKFDSKLQQYATNIGKAYAEHLQCKAALQDMGCISGVYRKPKTKLLYGAKDTRTIHMENKIRYCLDPQKIMFSSGNMDERIRMANISAVNETVVDLFAGIGYFTLPLAVYCKPKKIVACEINPESYGFLCENIVLNNVSSIVEPLLGDNTCVAPKNTADRVIMGYINDTYTFLPTAFESLKDFHGIIHYHDVFQNTCLPDKPKKCVLDIAEKYEVKTRFLNFNIIKSYAPGVSHFVLDVLVDKQ